MLSLLDSIENSAWITWVRDAETVFAYATVLAFHTFGMILVVGISAAIALRTLGVASDLPIAPLRTYVPLMWIGFYINAATGVVLFLLTGREFATNPHFWIKMLSIVGAVTTVRLLLAYLADPAAAGARPVPRKGRTLAGTVIICWLVAVTAGRLTAYDFLVGWQSAVAVLVSVVAMVLGVRYLAPRLFGLDMSA